ncbi:paramyosin-like isoform X2 [Dysidea avara]|uniref:paramyosin-like isoform X2 n=1 Tax=Dysidea avara TaxID=196820 RepID=UPI00332D834C
METWVDLLQAKNANKKAVKRKVRTNKTVKQSPVRQEVLLLDYTPANGDTVNETEQLRLELAEQQTVIADITRDRERLLKQVDSLWRQHHNDCSSQLTVGSHDPSLADMQLQGLRDALDQVTMEKNSVLSQLALQRDEMSSLANQLAEQQQRLVAITADKDHLSSELYSCQQSLEDSLAEIEQLRSELNSKDQAELSARNVEVEKRSLSCQQDNTLLQQQITSLQQVNNTLKVSNSTLEDSLIKAQLEIDKLKARYQSEISTRQSEMLKLQQAIDKAEEQVNKLNEEKDLLATSLRQETAHCSAMETEQSLLQAKYDQLMVDRQLLEQEVSVLQQAKETDHQQLLSQCEALRSELLEQTNSGVAVVTGLQDQLSEAKCQLEQVVGDYQTCQGQLDDTITKLCAVTVTNEQLKVANQKLSLQVSNSEAQLCKVKSDWTECCAKLEASNQEIDSLHNNCVKIKEQLVAMETSGRLQLQEQTDKLTNQLHQKVAYCESLEVDKQALERRISELEGIVNIRKMEVAKLQGSLNEMTRNCDQSLSDLQASNAGHMIQQQEIIDLKMQLSELEQQMSDKLELTNQMNLLLVQRAARIDELETLVGSCDANKQVIKQLDSKGTQTEFWSVQNEPDVAVDSAASSSSHSAATSSSHSAATSPSHCTGLHPSHSVAVSPSVVNQPQFDGADHPASVPHPVASVTSQTHSAATNHTHSTTVSPSLSSSHSAASSPTHSIANSPTQFVASSTMGYSHSDQLVQLKCSELQEELANQKRQYDHNIMLLKKQYSDDIVAMESSKQQQVSILKSQLTSLQNLLANKSTGLASLMSDQVNNMASLRTQQLQVEEECQLVTLVSQSQLQQVTIREENITHLLAEVELLRTRKAIMMEFSGQLPSQQERTLQVKIDKLQNKVSLLRGQLKKRNCHCNYLRLRLGYVLAEVRLYKRLKEDLDGQITVLQNGFELSSRQQLMCIHLLEQAQHMSSHTLTN